MMQFSWTTFFIEIFNFIILIWILKRLLYIPIKNVIERREKSIQDTVDQAHQQKKAAEVLESKYENRLNDWENEKEKNKKQLHQEMAEMKKKELEHLQAELAKAKDKYEAIQQHQFKEQVERATHESMQLATGFLSKIMNNFADAELESKIITTFVDDLSEISEEQLQILQSEIADNNTINIQSAFNLNEKQKNTITENIQKLSSKKLNFNFSQQPDLLAGLDVHVGSMSLQANLRDELKFFSEVGRGFIPA